MHKIYKIFIFLIILFFPISSFSHVEHYDNLKRIEFDIYRNNKNIGKHIFTFSKNMSKENKIFFLSIIFTQLIRGAGYFNGGFLFSIIIIFLTTLNIKNNDEKN